MPRDYAGNRLGTARAFDISASVQTFRDYVSPLDTRDFYTFTLSGRSSFDLTLNGMSANANVVLLNSSHAVLQRSNNLGRTAEAINTTLDAGTYYIGVYPGNTSASTYYNLSVSAEQVIATPDWVSQLGTASNFETTTDVAVDGEGNVYITGYTNGQLLGDNAGAEDGFLAKYDSSGTLQWISEIATSSNDYVNGIVIGSSGDIYIAGETKSDNMFGGGDAFVAQYDSDGNQVWIQKFGASTLDEANDIAIDSFGNLYLTGITFGSLGGANAGSFDAWVAQYDSSGAQQWIQQLGTSGYDTANAITVDNAGYVYITGTTPGSLGGANAGSDDAWVAQYDSSGTQQWIQQLGTSGSDVSTGVAVDSAGNVYITGDAGGSLGGSGNGMAYIAQYDNSGNLAWTTEFGDNLPIDSYDIKVDTYDNVYIAGRTQNAFGGINYGTWDAYWARFSTSGMMLESQTLGTTSPDSAAAIELDSLGHIYITGTTFGDLGGTSAGGTDFYVAQYSV